MIIARIVNKSMATGVVPVAFIKTLSTPLLKKATLNQDVLKNYRPVFNLPFISKVLERVVRSQLLDYLASTEQHEPHQSAYRPIHSTETALVRVVNDIQMALGRKNVAMLVLLDLSATFDTIDHSLMLKRLLKIDIVGTAHKWFSSYLRGREQSVFIKGTASQSVLLKYGVPQGSVLGPVLFTQYTVATGAICRRHGVSYQLYADDTQIYITFRIDDLEDQHAARLKIKACIAEIRAWMIIHRLKLNDDKTEYIFLVSANNSGKITPQPIRIGEATITPTPSALNIGVMVDDMLTMADHNKSFVKCVICGSGTFVASDRRWQLNQRTVISTVTIGLL